MAGLTAVRTSLDIGRVLSKAFPILGRHMGVFLLLSLLYSILTTVISMVGFGVAAALRASSGAGFNPALGGFGLLLALFEIAAFVGQFAFVQSLVSYACIAELKGQTPTFGSCAAAGFAHLLPVSVILVVRAFCEIIGYICLIIPGVFMAVLWSVAVPAQVGENAGVFGAFGRSGDVTQDNRWSVFGLILVVRVINTVAIIAAYIFGAAVLIVPLAAMGLAGGLHQGAPNPGFGIGVGLLMYAVFFVILTLFLSVNAAITAVSYTELLPSGDGRSPKELDAVFS